MPSLTFNHSEMESRVLKQMAEEQDMSQTAVLRQALRLYQMVHERTKQGQQLAFTKDGVVVPLVVVSMLMPLPPAPAPSIKDKVIVTFEHDLDTGWYNANFPPKYKHCSDRYMQASSIKNMASMFDLEVEYQGDPRYNPWKE